MLSPLTLIALQRHTCVFCEKPLTEEHTYPLIEPGQLLSQTTDTGPHHRACAVERLEDILRKDPNTEVNHGYIAALYTVQAAQHSPSGRILRIHDHDPDSTVIHLFSAFNIEPIVTIVSPSPFPRSKDRHLVTRPATYEEVEQWVLPAIQDATLGVPEAEKQEVVRQIARLHAYLKTLIRETAKDTPDSPAP